MVLWTQLAGGGRTVLELCTAEAPACRYRDYLGTW
jgi:hypothetical protein